MAASEFLCTVERFNKLTPTVFELAFTPSAPLAFKAGQFISIVIPGAGPKGRDLRRAYSIASAPGKQPIELCVKLVEQGPGTNFLHNLRPGDTFRGFAPYGDFTYEPRAGRHACFIATGTGIAPFRAMAMSEEFKAHRPKSALALLGVRTADELLYEGDFARAGGVQWVATVSQPAPGSGWSGFKGRVTDYLRALGADYPWAETEFYLCGNGAMINEVKAILADHGVSKDSIHMEKYY